MTFHERCQALVEQMEQMAAEMRSEGVKGWPNRIDDWVALLREATPLEENGSDQHTPECFTERVKEMRPMPLGVPLCDCGVDARRRGAVTPPRAGDATIDEGTK